MITAHGDDAAASRAGASDCGNGSQAGGVEAGKEAVRDDPEFSVPLLTGLREVAIMKERDEWTSGYGISGY